MSSPSLLSFIDAPVVVGDPEGRAAYVNPAFEGLFAVSGEAVKGQPLASLFEGGVREAVLSAVASVCQRSATTRFRVRHAGVGYAGMASPIVAEEASVGFVILFFENSAEHERMHTLQRELHQPVEEVSRALEELADGSARLPPEKIEALVGEAQRAVDRLRSASEQMSALLAGRRGAPDADFDPAEVTRRAASRLMEEFQGAGVLFEAHVPARLPNVHGDPAALEGALVQLLRARLADCEADSSVTLAGGTLERGGVSSVVLRIEDEHAAAGTVGPDEPEELRRLFEEAGAELRTRRDGAGGRATTLRLTAIKL